MNFTRSSRTTSASQPRRRSARLALAAASALAVALLIPSGVTGAYWTATAPGAAGTPGVGDWCATPDPATNDRAIRLTDLPAVTGAEGLPIRIAAIPVANNPDWGAGTGNRTLAVKLHACSTTVPSFELRITAWSNSTAAAATGAGAISWASGSGVKPSSRLNLTTGYGLEIQRLARWGQLDDMYGADVSNDDARRFSWLVSDPRSTTAPTAAPPCGDRRDCDVSLRERPATSVFAPHSWTAPVAAPQYSAATYAVNNLGSGSDWDAATRLAGSGNSPGTVSATTMIPSTAADTLTTRDGNRMQWVVIEWWGGTPSTDLIAEIVLLP